MKAFEQQAPEQAEEPQRWQIGLGWRYGYSFRHFVGSEEQEHRVEENSQVVNNVHLFDLSLRYSFDDSTSLSVGLPYLSARRSSGLRGPDGEVVRRYDRSHTNGIGDMTVVFNRLIWDPKAHPRSNLSWGLGLKLPTGEYRQKQNTLRLVNGVEELSIGIADPSVQPGDGAWGIVLELSGYRLLGDSDNVALYGSALYVLEPEGTNGVERPGARPGEEEVSVTDQYVGRLGLQWSPAKWQGWTLGLGGRIEGVPVRDLIGSDEGRRRPGYMVSVDPSVSWNQGPHSVSLSMPWAVIRNRQKSVADLRNGLHGDAAFPDYLLLLNYTRRF
ncbi:transporter [Pseudomarimonas arenosa]|uniref:Transporter n=1 Tax=Pseudomarimonas arenosa TaxID=2774145 RepID=A0AAW3ZU98_9GAMM|nr:transporter [Pseudomarimonas arenosa]MBD8527651.1 hypothetical protein [Pseudomarimonas arenosa]